MKRYQWYRTVDPSASTVSKGPAFGPGDAHDPLSGSAEYGSGFGRGPGKTWSARPVVAGTSASTPVFAGVVAKLNEVRLAKGAAPLGFLNPLLYKVGAAGTGFNDVTQGRNCGQGSCRGNEGFPALAGWDAATGWGSPNYEELKAAV